MGAMELPWLGEPSFLKETPAPFHQESQVCREGTMSMILDTLAVV